MEVNCSWFNRENLPLLQTEDTISRKLTVFSQQLQKKKTSHDLEIPLNEVNFKTNSVRKANCSSFKYRKALCVKAGD